MSGACGNVLGGHFRCLVSFMISCYTLMSNAQYAALEFIFVFKEGNKI